MDWKIFYCDGDYSNSDGPPELAPKRDVQSIIVADENLGRRTEYSDNFYIYVPDRGIWRGVDQFGLYDYMIEPGFKLVLYGRTLTDKEYADVWNRTLKDTYLPPKSAFNPDERKP